jgi:signal transducer and activator of transcription 5B
MGLFRMVRHCLNTEMKLVQQGEALSGGGVGGDASGARTGAVFNTVLLPDTNAEMAQQLQFLRRRTDETGEDLRKMEQEQEAFAINYHDCTKINGKAMVTILTYCTGGFITFFFLLFTYSQTETV